MILGELDFEKRGHLTRERGLHSSNSFEKERGDKGRIKEIRVKESRDERCLEGTVVER